MCRATKLGSLQLGPFQKAPGFLWTCKEKEGMLSQFLHPPQHKEMPKRNLIPSPSLPLPFPLKFIALVRTLAGTRRLGWCPASVPHHLASGHQQLTTVFLESQPWHSAFPIDQVSQTEPSFLTRTRSLPIRTFWGIGAPCSFVPPDSFHASTLLPLV